ncbi:hypothetical protein B0H19DRAFT_1173000, partial [Mycena capillaripes]
QLDYDFSGDFVYEFEKNSYWEQIMQACGIAGDGTRIPSLGNEKPETETRRTSTDKFLLAPSEAHDFLGREPRNVLLPETLAAR